MGNNRTYRLFIMIACFLFAGLQAVKVMKQEYSWLNVFFLITFLGIGIFYLFFYLKQRKS